MPNRARSLRSTLGRPAAGQSAERDETRRLSFYPVRPQRSERARRGHRGVHESYKTDLIHFVTEARKRGGLPVLVTSMNRRRFDAQGKIVPTLGDYPEAVRQTAKEQNVPLIDLNAMSKTLFETMGPDGTLKAFVHYPANTFPGQTVALKDDTHFNTYGAYELAKVHRRGHQSRQARPGKISH